MAGPPASAAAEIRSPKAGGGKPPKAGAAAPSNPETGAGEPLKAGLAVIDECPKAGSAGTTGAQGATAADDDDCPKKLMKR